MTTKLSTGATRMITIPSIVFGEIEVDEHLIYTFEQGIPGIRGVNKFLILDMEDNPSFKWLQACEPPYLTMMMVDPIIIDEKYQVLLDDGQMNDLDLEDPNDAFYMALVVIPEQPKDMTANLLAPVVFNFKAMKGMQVMINGSPDLLKVKVFKG
ncbi:MAG: flagellar assembly protein FliW [Acidobacteria bacterium]|nr:MAG: flagellar assembly protein FliW [Acidobacteriota bacterium]